MKNKMVTESEALWAMMLWEWALEEGAMDSDEARTLEWLKQEEGAYQARDNALLIAQQVIPASDWAYANGFDDSEDWSFIPKLMSWVQESCNNTAEVNPRILMECAKEVVREHLEQRS